MNQQIWQKNGFTHLFLPLGGEVPAKILDTHAGRELVRHILRKVDLGEFV
ncbi:hypothetical protein DFP75_101122 [Marinomonas alcarazii]|uniref:Antitoxin Xre/MbcA/ParS-like toxin-binding domain-containing protein n=1 Tax=Marinomonas alcarazii TaxID=491949 RepID=A0A318V8W4_9GAMM|nr:hypothetical protein DFP75_101122 [Marinomonas alcarazii]